MTSRKKPGRPAVQPTDPGAQSGGRSVYMHLTLSATLYDKSYEVARKQRMTVPEFLRHTLQQATTADPDRR